MTEGLRRRGVDVLTAQDDGASQVDDATILDRATVLGRVLFSQDEDFLALAAERISAGVHFFGLIYCHQLNAGIGEVIEDLELILHCATAEEMRSTVIYLPLQ